MAVIIIRIRSKDGQARVELDSNADGRTLRKKILQVLQLDDSTQLAAALDPQGAKLVDLQSNSNVASLGLGNGTMLYVEYVKSSTTNGHTSTAGGATGAESVVAAAVIQDPIDNEMEKQPGTIPRPKDPLYCKHGDRAMCDYCSPLEPYDAKYLEKNKIKHMSFHAYLRQVTNQNNTAPITSPKFIPPLEEQSFKVRNPCPSQTHGPYPAGICTKCQPSAVSLNPQPFRMVDFLEFETPGLIDSFLSYWRKTGVQRFGYLYGRYEPYTEVPLGVKAVVSAIYEPPQVGEPHGLQLTLPDAREEQVDQIAALLGLRKVGMIYTDLLDDGTGEGTVVCRRHGSSYFLSSAECIFAAQLQLKHQTPSKYSASGHFGSRFVTCVLSGNEDGGIDFQAYQVSNMAMAMTRDEIIEASVDPTKVRVRESTPELYVPEVFYKYKNEYGIMVQEAAKPTFPVEYLLVTVSHGFPINPVPTFTAPAPFIIENRDALEAQHQDLGAARQHLEKGPLVSTLSDFHLIVYLYSLSILDEIPFRLACNIARTHSETDAQTLIHTGAWQTLTMILQEAPISSGPSGFGMSGGSSSSAAGASDGPTWSCPHCTFANPARNHDCGMCGLPKS
ncbi:hypothetical protein SmJEL517_g05507 [Synchytrium microbalum]|uniref:Nuclear protein localization protein 4 n=1 Tax=Synchytrium microbalum TaxID=1806994 RepID=A0A507BZA8_9FUNG|nr:uncharacterized protein SmJEL517_g05507 [Synchytrium microbalum]TPX31086.1 hypothetical protein SmJEL517_g05507 [Synchytrium microbalum]